MCVCVCVCRGEINRLILKRTLICGIYRKLCCVRDANNFVVLQIYCRLLRTCAFSRSQKHNKEQSGTITGDLRLGD